jgi:hypothetical protein
VRARYAAAETQAKAGKRTDTAATSFTNEPDSGSPQRAATSTTSASVALRELKALYDEGILTSDEYEVRRQRLLKQLDQ